MLGLNPAPELAGMRQKLDRAYAHMCELDGKLRPFVRLGLDDFSREDDGDPTKIVYRIRKIPDIDAECGPIIGDVLHNIRSAWDHLAWRLVELDGGMPSEHTQFPVYDSRTNDKGNPRNVTIQPQINRIDILAAVDAVQPYQRQDPLDSDAPRSDQLSVLTRLNNIDKHRLLVETVAAFNYSDSWWGPPSTVPTPDLRLNPSALQNGSPVAWFDFKGTRAPANFDPHLTLAVVIDEGLIWAYRLHAPSALHMILADCIFRMNLHFVPLFGGSPIPTPPQF